MPDQYAKCADCGKETPELDQGQTVYCASCGGKRRAKQQAKAAKKAADKAVKPAEDK